MKNILIISAFFTCFISSFNVYSADVGIPIIDTVISGDISKLKQLISSQIDVNETDSCGRSAIMYAYHYNNENMMDLIKILLEAGSDDIVNIHGSQVVRAGLFSDDFVNKQKPHKLSPVYYKHCYLDNVDRCPNDVLKKVYKIINKKCEEW